MNITKKINLIYYLKKYAIYFVLLFLITFFSLLSPYFFTVTNLFNILRQVSVIGIAAVGMGIVIISGGIDLSTGSTIGIAGALAAWLMLRGLNPIFAFLLMLILGALIGLINGFFIASIGLASIIATLGTMTSLRGVTYIITQGTPIFGFSKSYSIIGQGYIFNKIPISVIIMIFVFILGYIILEKTRFGRYVYAIGSNAEIAHLAGINVKKMKFFIFCIGGILSAFAGLVLLSRLNSAQPTAGDGYELDIITAVVLGGVSIRGGEGKIISVIVGVLIIGVLSNGMIMLDLQEFYQWVVKGLALLAAVSYDTIMKRKGATS